MTVKITVAGINADCFVGERVILQIGGGGVRGRKVRCENSKVVSESARENNKKATFWIDNQEMHACYAASCRTTVNSMLRLPGVPFPECSQ